MKLQLRRDAAPRVKRPLLHRKFRILKRPDSIGGSPTLLNVGPGWSVQGGRSKTHPGSSVFRKHHRPCGQHAVEGGFALPRPLPAQAGHFNRRKAMPSDLPLMSTGLAIYPVPPQRGQRDGSTCPPRLKRVFHQKGRNEKKSVFCYEIRTNRGTGLVPTEGQIEAFTMGLLVRRRKRLLL